MSLGRTPHLILLPVVAFLPGDDLHQGFYPAIRQKVRQPTYLLGFSDGHQDPAVMSQCLGVIDHPLETQDVSDELVQDACLPVEV